MDCWSSSTIFIKLRFQHPAFFLDTLSLSYQKRKMAGTCLPPFKIFTHYGCVLRFSEIAAGAYNVSVGRFLATPTPIVLDYQNTDITRLCLRRQTFGTLIGWISSPNSHDDPRCGALLAMLDLYIERRPCTVLPSPTHLFAHYQNYNR